MYHAKVNCCHVSSAALKQICIDYNERVIVCEAQKYDLDFEVRKKDYEVSIIQIIIQNITKFTLPLLDK